MNWVETFIQERKKHYTGRKNVAIVGADDAHTLEAVVKAAEEGFVFPIAIGNEKRIYALLEEMGKVSTDMQIIHSDSPEESATIAVELINNGMAAFIMKGAIETKPLMQKIVAKESHLRTDRIMSHIGFTHLDSYHKLFAVTDCAMNLAPTLEEKKQILLNAVETLNKMGIKNPKTGILAASETLNPKLTESTDACILKQSYLKGEIPDCILEGPISLDLAMSREAAEIKGYDSPVAGDVDLLLVPNLTAGNIFGKALIYGGGAVSCGFIVGAKIPIVITSRAATVQDKYYSLILASTAC